jgi:hypothetical protein
METMDFLFRKGLILAGYRDNPEERQRLFERFGGSDDLRRLCAELDSAVEAPCLRTVDPFDPSFPDPNLVAGYFDEPSPQSGYQRRYEEACRDSDTLLAEAVSTARILRLFEEEATSAPKSCRQRAYRVGERESVHVPCPAAPSDKSASRAPDSGAAKPARRKLFSGFSSRPAGKRHPYSMNREAFDELSRFDVPVSRSEKKTSSRPLPVEKAAPRPAPVESDGSQEKRRSRFLPLLCASIAVALLFHFLPILRSIPERTLPPESPTHSAVDPVTADTTAERRLRLSPSIGITEEVASKTPAESIPAFEEAPLHEKIATPPSAEELELSDEFPEVPLVIPTAPSSMPLSETQASPVPSSETSAPFAWRDLSILSEAERASLTGVRPAYRPMRRGMKTDVVTMIPIGE